MPKIISGRFKPKVGDSVKDTRGDEVRVLKVGSKYATVERMIPVIEQIPIACIQEDEDGDWVYKERKTPYELCNKNWNIFQKNELWEVVYERDQNNYYQSRQKNPVRCKLCSKRFPYSVLHKNVDLVVHMEKEHEAEYMLFVLKI